MAWHRYYDPGTGRFLSEDPIGFEGGDFNVFNYVSKNPLRYNDPFGLLKDPRKIVNEALDHPMSSSGTDDWANGFQHCLASCMMTAENGNIAAFLAGHAFEAENGYNGQSKAQWAMDVANNEKGRKLGEACPYQNRTSFDEANSKKIADSCATSCLNTSLTFMSTKK